VDCRRGEVIRIHLRRPDPDGEIKKGVVVCNAAVFLVKTG